MDFRCRVYLVGPILILHISEKVDLKGAIVAPGYLDLQINGRDGVHFTSLGQPGKTKEDAEFLAKVAEGEARSGVTGWYVLEV